MEKNRVTIDIQGNGKLTLTKESVDKLNRRKPKNCPYNDYTLLDLLKDMVCMYSWRFGKSEISVEEFVKKLGNYTMYMYVFGKDIIDCLL